MNGSILSIFNAFYEFQSKAIEEMRSVIASTGITNLPFSFPLNATASLTSSGQSKSPVENKNDLLAIEHLNITNLEMNRDQEEQLDVIKTDSQPTNRRRSFVLDLDSNKLLNENKTDSYNYLKRSKFDNMITDQSYDNQFSKHI